MAGRWLKIKRHRDGTVSYFSNQYKKWILNVREIPEKELSSMTHEEQRLILSHLAKHS